MTSVTPEIAVLTAVEAEASVDALSEILVDRVPGGPSVGYMLPFGLDDARPFWRRIAGEVARGDRVLLGASLDGALMGTVQRGLGRPLMMAAEAEAIAHGRTLLTMDTVTGSIAERLYLALGHVRVGVIPGYARMPDGPLRDATLFYKQLDQPAVWPPSTASAAPVM